MYSQAEELKEMVTKLISLVGGNKDQKHDDQDEETLIPEEKNHRKIEEKSGKFKSLEGNEFADF
jgi:hypothetical protein